MQKTLHRLFCLLLCAVMVVGMFPATAFAAQNDKAAAEYKETTVTTEEEGYMVTVGENGQRTYTPTTFEKKHTVSVPAQNEGKLSFPAKDAITATEWGTIEFTTFEDLKELATRTYPEWTSVQYRGDEDLVISESLTLPKYLDLYLYDADLIIPEGVTLNVTSDVQVYDGGELNVAGNLILNGSGYFKGDVTITGTVSVRQSIRLQYGEDHVGLEKIQFLTEWASINYSYDVEDFAELKAAVAVAKANPGTDYDISLQPDADVVISSNLTIPENAYFSCWSSWYSITVNSGVTLTINGDCTIGNNMTVKGKLVNNGRFNYYGNNNDCVLKFTTTDSYSGKGRLLVYVNEDDTGYTNYVTGLGTTDMEIVEYRDEWSHYWQIRDISGLTRLGTPSSLTWNKAERYTYNESTDEWESNLETYYGAIRFKPSKIVDKGSEYTLYRITLYKDDKQVYEITYGYNNEYLKQSEYVDEYLCNDVDFTSGTYHFTVQAIAESEDYMDGPVSTSKTWTYTKPSSRYARPTGLKWENGPEATWTSAVENYSASMVQLYYAPTADAEPTQFFYYWSEDMIAYDLDEWMVEQYGTGYYYFKVRTLSQNITKKFHSAWTELSKAYHYTGEAKPVAPSMEVFFDATLGCPRVELKRSPGANDYEIYRATSKTGTYKKIDTVQLYDPGYWHPYYDTTATVGRTYYYKVRAVSYTGVKSSFCSVGSCKVKLAMPQVTITNDASTGKPVVKWETVEGASKYYIYRSTSKTGDYKKVSTAVSARSYKDTETKAGKIYYYYVVAVYETSTYNSNPSVTVYTRCDLKRPVVTISNSTSGYPYLKWSAISGAEKYEIYRATSKTGTYKKIKTTTATKFTDKDVTEGKTYYYRVKAIHANSGANSAYSATDYIKAK